MCLLKLGDLRLAKSSDHIEQFYLKMEVSVSELCDVIRAIAILQIIINSHDTIATIVQSIIMFKYILHLPNLCAYYLAISFFNYGSIDCINYNNSNRSQFTARFDLYSVCFNHVVCLSLTSKSNLQTIIDLKITSLRISN